MKLKYILPVATIASVATAVTPLAVSCGTKSIELDRFVADQVGSMVGCKASKPINIKANTKYHIINKKESWSHIDPEWLEENSFFFLAFENNVAELPHTLIPKEASVTVNGTKLTKVNDSENVGKNQFFAGKIQGEFYGVMIGEGTMINFEKIEANISYTTGLDDANIYFVVN